MDWTAKRQQHFASAAKCGGASSVHSTGRLTILALQPIQKVYWMLAFAVVPLVWLLFLLVHSFSFYQFFAVAMLGYAISICF